MRKEFSARMGLLTLAVILGTLCANAQSTVYVFSFSASSASEPKSTLTINGKESVDLIGPYKKTMTVPRYAPLKVFHNSVRKIIMNSEGPTSFSLKYIWSSALNPDDIKTITADTEIDITKGSVYYLKIGAKGLNGLQIKQISEKEGQKLLKNDKYYALPDYTFDPNTNN